MTGQPHPLAGYYSRLDDSARSDIKFENRLREAYVDLKLKDLPLSFRLGRQQMTKLKIYAGPGHPHQAQQPVEFKLPV